MDSLSEYDDLGEKCYLVDELIDILEDINEKDGGLEGRYYHGMMYLAKKGTEIPKLFQTINAGSAFTEETYKMKVMMILGVQQNKNGDLVMDLLAKKIRN